VAERFWHATRTLATATGPIEMRPVQAAHKIPPVLPEDLPEGGSRALYQRRRESLVMAAAPKMPERQAATLAASNCDLTNDISAAVDDW